VPESLGGKAYILKAGVVCDKCNNYFAREVEKPFMDLPNIHALRFNEGLESKKGIIPPMDAILNNRHPVGLWKDKHDYQLGLAGHVDVDENAFESIINSKRNIAVFLAGDANEAREPSVIVSRFIGKMAIEFFAHRILESEWESTIDLFIDDTQFDDLRNHVRRGTRKNWPCHTRRIYDSKREWNDPSTKEDFQVVNESDFLITKFSELYFVFALFGLEYTINVGGADIEGYLKWLECHNNASILYMDKKDYYKNNPITASET
jgi:hypothetical protein